MGACASKSVLKNVDDAPLPAEEREDVVAVEEVNAANDEVAAVERQSLGLLIKENEEEKEVKEVVDEEAKEAVAVGDQVVETEEAKKDIIVETCDEKEVAGSDVKVAAETEEKSDHEAAETTSEVEVTKVEEEKNKTTDNKKPLFKLWF
ncbi:hypothetical protein ACS0TY_030571 [Phlomoides rotata]